MPFICVFVWGVNTSSVSLYTLYPSLPAPPWLPPIAFLVWKCLSSFPSLNPFFFLFLSATSVPSFSLLWKVLQFGVSVPVVSMPTGCQGSGLVRSRAGLGCGGERERERESPSQASQTCFCPLEQQGQYPTSQLTGQLSRGELEHGEYQTAGCYRQYTNSMSVLSKGLAKHAVCTVSLAQTFTFKFMLIFRINENKKKYRNPTGHSYRHNYVKVNAGSFGCAIRCCEGMHCGLQMNKMSGWWPSITPLVSSCRPWWPCDIGVCRAKEGDFGLLVRLPSSMIIEKRSIWPWDHYIRCIDLVRDDDFDFELWTAPQSSCTAGTHNQTHVFIYQLTFSAAAFVPIGTVDALGSILAGSAGALITGRFDTWCQ